MNPKRIAQSVDEYISSLGDILAGKAAGAHILGDLKAQRRTGEAIAFNLVKQEALDYIRDYKKLLEEEGATMIKGEKIAWLADQNRELRKKIGDTIETGLREGKSIDDIKNDLKDVWDETDRRLKNIARTEIARAQMHGTTNRYTALGVERVEYVAGLDERTCQECMALHGKIFRLAEAPELPLHPMCRCDYLVILEED